MADVDQRVMTRLRAALYNPPISDDEVLEVVEGTYLLARVRLALTVESLVNQIKIILKKLLTAIRH